MIHTVGNGELLERVFSSLSHVLYGGEEGIQGTFRLLVRLTLTFGAFAALCLAFMRQKFEPLIKSFFLPALAILSLLLAPRSTLEIHDYAREGRKTKVENVPWFLASAAGWSSELFYRVRVLFEEAVRVHYPWTERIGAGAAPFLAPKVAETELRTFCRECVFRDLKLGVYNKEELAKSADLFDFFKQRTARNRTMLYRGSWIPCREAIEKIDASLTGDLLVDALIEGDLSERERSLRQLFRGEEKQWVKQQIAIRLLQEEKSQSSWTTLAASSIPALRNFSEALLYLIFPLILLLALLSFGLKLILHWLKLLVWISLWPIFYVAVDLFLQTLWESRLPAAGLTLGTADEIASLYRGIEITAALLLASIPFFTWAFLQGGLSQLSHHVSVSSKHEVKAPENAKSVPEKPLVQSAPKQSGALLTTRVETSNASTLIREQEKTTIQTREKTAPAYRGARQETVPIPSAQTRSPGMPPPIEKEAEKMQVPLKEEPPCGS